MAKYDVFISYSLQDSDEVNKFVNLLTSHIPTLACYTDVATEELDDAQKNAIEDSDCLLYMQSGNSLLSQRVKDEVAYTKGIGKRVVPVLLKDSKKSGWYMFEYGSLGFVDSTNSAEVEKLIDGIAEWTGKASTAIVEPIEIIEDVEVAESYVAEEQNNTPFNELFVYEVFTSEKSVEESVLDECTDEGALGEYTIEEVSTDEEQIYDEYTNDDAPFEEFPNESYYESGDELSDEQNSEQYSDTSVFDESSNESSPFSYETIGERDATEADTGEYIDEPHSAKAPETAPDESAKQPEIQLDKQVPLGFRLILVVIVIIFGLFKLCSSGEDYTSKRESTEGLIAVSRNGKWGFVNSNRKEVVPIKYDIVEDYHNGFAIVGLNGKWGYVNKVGKEIVPIKFDEVLPFIKDRGCVKLNGKYGLVDTFGRILVNPKYDNPISFAYDDYAPVAVDGKWGIVDKNGKEVLSLRYDDVGAFFDGVARVQKDGKFGFVGIDGTIIANPIYDKAREFVEGCAAVQKNGKWGFVDNKGNTIVYPKYAQVEDFKNSRAAVMSDGKWGFIDNSGKEVIPLKYDSVSSFITNSYAGTFTMVTLNGERFFIDENGASIKFS